MMSLKSKPRSVGGGLREAGRAGGLSALQAPDGAFADLDVNVTTKFQVQPDSFANERLSLALRTASLIEQNVFADIGQFRRVLSSEEELSKQYRVGRQAMRMAIRILQFRGTIRMQMGSHGGLVISPPRFSQMVLQTTGKLMVPRPDLDHIRQARRVLSVVATMLAAEQHAAAAQLVLNRLQNRGGSPDEEYSHQLDEPARFVVALASCSKNIALELFAYTLANIANIYTPRELVNHGDVRLWWTRACEDSIVTAIRCGDVDTARGLVEDYHRNIDQRIGATAAVHLVVPPPGCETLRHQASRLARRIVYSIVEKGRAPGERLGSEDDLCADHLSPRTTVRAALRILEADGLILTRPGRGGGIFVGMPDQRAMAGVIGGHLRALGLATHSADRLIRMLMIGSTERDLHGSPSRQQDHLDGNPFLHLLVESLNCFLDFGSLDRPRKIYSDSN
jgi:DNA-binding FadR family transcriptional regulator